MDESYKKFPDSLWSETSVPGGTSTPLDGDAECDVAIIGAGFTGLRAALALAEAGTSVMVLEAGEVGWGASGRTGGQVNPMLPFNGPDEVRKLVGPGYFEKLTETSLQSADELFTLIRDYQIDCQARQNGWLRVDHCKAVQRKSRADAEIWNRHGGGMEFLAGEELHKLLGSDAYNSGILVPKGGAVHPLSLARGLARVASTAGAQIFSQTRVTRLEQADQRWRVHTENGQVSATWVILATNGYTDGLLPGLSGSVIPLVPIQIATSPLESEQIAKILPGGHTVSDTRRVIMYARREPDDRMVFGSLGKMTLRGEITGHDWLENDAERIFPSLKGVNWKYRWGGKIALTQDRLPHFHEPKPGLIAGLGYNGRGVAMAHVMGRVLAERVLGAAPESLPFPVSSVTKIPFRGVQMLGKSTAIWWMKLRDQLEIRAG